MLPGLGVVRGPSPPPSGNPLTPPPVCPPSHIALPAAATPSDTEGEAPGLCYCLRWLPHTHSNWKKCVFKICKTNTIYREIFSLILFLSRLLLLSAGKYKTGQIRKSQLSLFKHNCIWANSTPGETICKWRVKKKPWDKNNSVYSILDVWLNIKRKGLHLHLSMNFISANLFHPTCCPVRE